MSDSEFCWSNRIHIGFKCVEIFHKMNSGVEHVLFGIALTVVVGRNKYSVLQVHILQSKLPGTPLESKVPQSSTN